MSHIDMLEELEILRPLAVQRLDQIKRLRAGIAVAAASADRLSEVCGNDSMHKSHREQLRELLGFIDGEATD